MSLVLCRHCLRRLRLLDVASATAPRRGLKRTPMPPSSRSQVAASGPKWFVRRLAELPDAPMRPQPLPSPGGRWAATVQIAARLAGTAVVGGALCLAVAERRRDGDGRLRPFDFGYVDEFGGGGGGGFLRDLRQGAPCAAFCLTAALLGNLLRTRRLSPASLSAACRHLLDRPGRSVLLTSPWLSALCLFHGSELLISGSAMAALSLINFGFTPEEKILVFLTGAWAGSTARCAYQALGGGGFGPWQGAHAGLAALAALFLLSMRREAQRAQQRHSNRAGEGEDSVAMPRSARRILLEQRPGLCVALLAGWAGLELAGLLVMRRRRMLGGPGLAAAVPPELHHVTSLAGLAAAWGIHACVEEIRWGATNGASAASSAAVRA